MSATSRTLRFEDWQLEAKDEAEYHAMRKAQYEEEYKGLSTPIMGREALFELEDPAWAMEDMIQAGGLTILHGNPGSGKSLVAMDWAYTLAHDKLGEWLGKKKDRQYKPLYLFTEGLSGLKRRTLAWERERAAVSPDVVYVRDPVILNPKDGTSQQLSSLEKLYVDHDRDILFIDTLANTFGGNENQQEDANRYLHTIRHFQKWGPVVLVHHNKKDDKEYRGSTVFQGAADTMVSLTMGKHGVADLRITKQKDGDPEKGFMQLKLKQHQISNTYLDRTSVAFSRETREPDMSHREREVLEMVKAAGGEAQLVDLARDLDVEKRNLKRDIKKYESLEYFYPGGNNPGVVRVLKPEEPETL